MGIKGIYNEIGPGQRIALSKLAIETLEQQGRPLRLAIDTSIWLFQIQSGKGGTNPALRTFYYRLLRLISLSIHPLFVFDGPNKPPFKRGKRTGPNIASIPEFLAKQLLKQFALPFHIAPGEAEAECALLQREGIVDAVLSEDVDTLMFGSGLTMRNWSPEGTLKTRTFTHVNLYDAAKTKEVAGLDREGMILVALMSGGDYVPEGIPGCGPKTACEAARAGFGKDLCAISRNDTEAIAAWKTRLVLELRTNESKFFRSKHKALVIPDDFPRQDVLRYYTHPCISGAPKLDSLRQTLQWDQEIDLIGLRTFTAEAFDWVCFSGAKKFVRNLAPALLAKELRLHAGDTSPVSDDTYDTAIREAQLVKTIHLTRQHISTDNMTELRIGFVPINLVPIDLEAEDPDPELPLDDESDGEEAAAGVDVDVPDETAKKRGPLLWDPTVLEKIWVPETLIRLGVPLKLQDWEESFRDARKFNAMKGMTQRAEKAHKARGGMPTGAIDRYTKVTKPGRGLINAVSKEAVTQENDRLVDRSSEPPSVPSQTTAPPNISQQRQSSAEPQTRPKFRLPPIIPPTPPKTKRLDVVDLASSPEATAAKRKRILRRSQSDTSSLIRNPPNDKGGLTNDEDTQSKATNRLEQHSFESIAELPSSVTIRRHRSPLRRTQSISSTTSAKLHQTTLLDSKRPLFQNPPACPASPGLPSVAQTVSATTAKVTAGSNASRNPSTPKKSKARTIITISSSPVATPKSNQKSMTQYLSPSRKECPESPSRSRTHRPQSTLILQLGTRLPLQTSTSTEELCEPTKAIEKPMFRLPLAASQPTSLNISRSSSTSSNSTSETSMTKGSSRNTMMELTALQESNAPAQIEVLRRAEYITLRESFDGAWGMTTATNSAKVADAMERNEGEASDAGKKRKRMAGAPLRQWKLSQVGIVDLT